MRRLHRALEAIDRGSVVGVEAEDLVRLEDKGVCGADPIDCRIDLAELLDHVLLVRDRHAQAANAKLGTIVDELVEVFRRHAEGDVNRVDPGRRQRRVVDVRAERVADRVADHSVDDGFAVDFLVTIDLRHLLEAELAGSEEPLMVECGVDERRVVASAEDARGCAHIAHAHRDGRDSLIAQ